MTFTTLRRWFQKLKRTPYVRPKKHLHARPRIEQLEDRVNPSSLALLATDQSDYAPGSTATFTGTGFEIGENVNISIVADNGNSEAFSVTDGGANDLDGEADGNFSALWLCDPNGAYFAATLTATATGDLGSSASTIFTDDVSAKPGTPDLIVGSDTFATDSFDSSGSNNDNLTKNTSLTFAVSGVNGATITLLKGGTTLGTAVVSSGTATFTGITLAMGSHTITAKQLESGKTVSPLSNELEMTVDTSAPGAPTITSLQDDSGFSTSDNVTRDSTPSINLGSISSPGLTRLYDFGPTGFSVPVLVGSEDHSSGSNQNVGISLALGNGLHVIKATQLDNAGNESAFSADYTVVVDLIAPVAPAAPTVVVNSPSAGQVTVSGSVNVATGNPSLPATTGTSLSVPAASKIRLFVDGVSVPGFQITTTGAYSFIYTPTAGPHSYSVEHEDRAGNSVGLGAGVVQNVVTTEVVSLSLVAANTTYNGSPYAGVTLTGPTATPVAPVGTTTITYYANAGATILLNGTGLAPTNAGTGIYWVRARFASSNLAQWTDADSNIAGFNIAQASSTTTTVGDGPFTYTGLTHTGGSGIATGAGVITGSATLTYTGDQINSGTYYVTAHYAGDANHTASDGVAVAIVINQADLTVNVGPACKIFGAAPTDLAAELGTTVPTGVNGENLSIAYSSLNNTVGAGAGVYANDIAGDLSDGSGLLSNYNVTVNSGTFTVNTGLAGGTTVNAKLFLLLANSDDIGTYFDVTVQMLDSNGNVIAQGAIDRNRLAFINNSMTNTAQNWATNVSLTVTGDHAMAVGSSFSFRILSKIDEGAGHRSGTAAIQYDAAIRSSQLTVNFGNGNRTFYLHSEFDNSAAALNSAVSTGLAALNSTRVMSTTDNGESTSSTGDDDTTVSVNKASADKLATLFGVDATTGLANVVKTAYAWQLLGCWTGVVS